MAQVRRMVEQAAGRIEFVVVGKVKAENVKEIVLGTDISHVHSGTGVRDSGTRHGVVSARRVAQLAQALQEAASALGSV